MLRSGQLSLGPRLGEFEDAFAAWLGVDDAVAVSSGTAGLHLAVRALGWGEGDGVLTTPLSFVASSNCLLYEGAEPVFCDVDPVTLNMDPATAEAAARGTGSAAGILPVHIFGYPADLPALEEPRPARCSKTRARPRAPSTRRAGGWDRRGTPRASPSTPTSR